MEYFDVSIVDILVEFMQADMEGTVYVKLEGDLAELLVEIDPPRYQHFLKKVGATPVLYVLLKKALYGTFRLPFFMEESN